MHELRDGRRSAVRTEQERDYVEFWPAGTAASGWFLCTACGNPVIVRQILPRCMVCGQRLWERAPTSEKNVSSAV